MAINVIPEQGMPAGPPQGMPPGMPPEMAQGMPPMPPMEAPPEQAPQEATELDQRLAYIMAMEEAESIVGESNPDDWVKAFKKILQANLLKVPGKQNISVNA